MRIYLSRDGKQLLADMRAHGGGRDIALGTHDWGAAAARAAELLAQAMANAPPPGSAMSPQLELPTAGGRPRYLLSQALSYLVARGTKREATQGAHKANARYLLSAMGDRDVNAVDWYDAFLDARAGWLEAGLTHDTCNKRQATLSRALTLANRPLGRGERFLDRPAHLPSYLDSQTIARTRWFQPEEIAAFVDAILTYSGPVGASDRLRNLIAGRYDSLPGLRRGRAVRFLIRSWTGLRNGDARKLRVSHFNLVTNKWYRLSSKKSQPAVWLDMVDPLRAIVEEWLVSRPELRPADPMLYPWTNEHRGLNILAQALRVEPVTPHDFRRTAAHLIRLCGFDKDYCRRWLGLAGRSQMLEQVYLQDDPLAQPDPARVRDIQQRIGGAVAFARRRRLTPPVGLLAEPIDVEYSNHSTSTEPPNGHITKHEEKIMDKTDDELATRRNLREVPENYGDAEGRKEEKKVGPAGFEPAAYGLKVQRGIGEITREKGEITPLTSNEPPKSPGNSGARCEEVADFADGRHRCTKAPGHRARCSFMGSAPQGDAPAAVLCVCRHGRRAHVLLDGACNGQLEDGRRLRDCACRAFHSTASETALARAIIAAAFDRDELGFRPPLTEGERAAMGPPPFNAGPGVCGDRTDSGRFYCSLPRHGDEVRHFYGGVTSEAGVDDRPSVLEAPEGPTLVTLCATCNLGLNANPSHYDVGPAGHEFVNGGAK